VERGISLVTGKRDRRDVMPSIGIKKGTSLARRARKAGKRGAELSASVFEEIRRPPVRLKGSPTAAKFFRRDPVGGDGSTLSPLRNEEPLSRAKIRSTEKLIRGEEQDALLHEGKRIPHLLERHTVTGGEEAGCQTNEWRCWRRRSRIDAL